MSSSSSPIVPSKHRLDAAIQSVLESNFDVDSKMCLLTVMKMMDNILSKPENDKVRSIRMANPAFHSKVVARRGHEILLAVGFVQETTRPLLGGGGGGGAQQQQQQQQQPQGGEDCLVLKPEHENTSFLVEARRLLQVTLVHQLQIPADQLPTMPTVRPKGAELELKTSVSARGSRGSGFDPYRGQRFDGQSAAVGTSLGPPEGWKSKTETELEALQRKQQQLEHKLQQQKPSKQANNTISSKGGASVERQWELQWPGQPSRQQPTTSSSSAAAAAVSTTDSALLAQHFQQQHAKRLQDESRGFSTKAMRDLEKIKRQKVYSHTVLAITFADGVIVKATFGPREKVQDVVTALETTVLVQEDVPSFELYQTPPRTLLDPTKTLVESGLVPAAKVHVSWKKSPPGNQVGGYLRPDFVQRQNDGPAVVAMPTAAAVVGGDDGSNKDGANKKTTTASTAAAPKKKKTKAEKEKDLLARMLGK